MDIRILQIALPLGISFFTFQQIAYVTDCFLGRRDENSFREYVLFVSFFPQLIAGPIVLHKETIPQFQDHQKRYINYSNIYSGLSIFAVGLFKKVVIADTLAIWVHNGFDVLTELTFLQAWIASVSYSLQLYFDFSGYSEMAIGLALMFNIDLPLNFYFPYRSKNIQIFWKRWHITLGRFLRDYIYFPLGGSRFKLSRTLLNVLIVFILCGIWHGAGWTFILWGTAHGLAMVIHRLWNFFYLKMPSFVAWFITIFFVNTSWVVFRSENIHTAFNMLKIMFFPENFDFTNYLGQIKMLDNYPNSTMNTLFIISVFILTLFAAIAPVDKIKEKITNDTVQTVFIAFMIVISIIFMNGGVSDFLYFNF